MNTVRICLLWLLLAAPCFGQVKAVITGPHEAAQGDLVILDASQSVGVQYRWLLVNSKKTYLPIESGLKCVFASGAPGEYIFVLVVAGVDNNDKLAVEMTEHRLLIGGPVPPPTPPPGPDPPTPPPTPDPTEPVAALVVLRDQTTITSTQARVLSQLQLELSQRANGPQMVILEKGTTQTAAKYALRVPGSARLPFYFGVTKVGKVLFEGELPADPQTVLELLR